MISFKDFHRKPIEAFIGKVRKRDHLELGDT